MDELKAGYKTTEFWLTLAAVLAAILQNMLELNSPGERVAAAVVAGLAAIGYTASRTVFKLAKD
jgi:hypothetical protein